MNAFKTALRNAGIAIFEEIDGKLEEAEEATAILVASGYNWDCPNCFDTNHTIQTPSIGDYVTCPGCQHTAKVIEIEHNRSSYR